MCTKVCAYLRKILHFLNSTKKSSLNSDFKNEALELCNDLHKNKENLRLAHRKFCGQVGFKNVEILKKNLDFISGFFQEQSIVVDFFALSSISFSFVLTSNGL